jgi:hypothetical protein
MRRTPRAGKAEAVQPFNGRDLKGWKLKGDAACNQWAVCRAASQPCRRAASTSASGRSTSSPKSTVVATLWRAFSW